MRRAAMAATLIICLLSLIALSGCLFGKKRSESAPSETGAKAAGPAPGGGPGAPPAAPGAPKAGGPAPGGPPAGAPPGPGAPAGPKPVAAPAGGSDGALVKQAKAAKAAGDYDKALQLLAGASPTDPEAQWLVAWMLAEQGQKELAAAAFNAFIASAKPSDARVAQAKAALKRLAAGAMSASGPGAGIPGPK